MRPSSSATVGTRSERNAHFRPVASSLRLPSEHVERIDRSHERCAALGLSRIGAPEFDTGGRGAMSLLRERNRLLFSRAAPVMEMLHEQIVDTESMVVLCDAAGTVLHAIGDDDFLARAEKVALHPGVNWSEPAKGTNAIGTALVSECATLVHADEHFMHANQFLTCSAAPILDPRGNILGVLDVTGDHRSYHQHTMALVKMSARMIENHWMAEDCRHFMRLHFHGRMEWIGTLMEGIVAVSAEGGVLGANRSACELLGLGPLAIRRQSLESLLGVSVGALVDHFRSPLAAPSVVHTADGRALHLLARFDWPVWNHIADAAHGANPLPAVAAVAAVVEADTACTHTPPALAATAALSTVAEPAAHGAMRLDTLAESDAAWAAPVAMLRRVLNQDMPVVLQGPSGSGKATLAQAMHLESARSAGPFVSVRCDVTPAEQLSSLLFGPAGDSDHLPTQGRWAQARGGTLYLAEVAALPQAAQARLMSLLEHLHTPMVGDTTRLRRGWPQLITSTRMSLLEHVRQGRLREDLCHHISALVVPVPALRERADVATLAVLLLRRWWPNTDWQVSDAARVAMQSYSWPGNLRQLCSGLRAAALLALPRGRLGLEHLPLSWHEPADGPGRTGATASGAPDGHAAPGPARDGVLTAALNTALTPTLTTPISAAHGAALMSPADTTSTLGDIKVEAMRRAVAAAGGNLSLAAKRLGVSRNTIYRKLRWNERDGQAKG